MKNISEITSAQNNLVKYCVKLQNPKFRKSEKMILADGEKTIQGFVDCGVEFEYIFLKKDDEFLKSAKAKNFVLVNNAILEKISTLKTPNSAVGIIREPQYDRGNFLKLDRIALLENIKDAGNLGTIVRSAAAFSIEGLVLLGDCVDIYNTKTIRSAAQNMFKIPIIRTSDIDFIKELKQERPLIATVVNSNKEFFDYKFGKRFIIALGSEAQGLSREIADLSDEKLTIRMDNGVESINLGVCASIAFAAAKSKGE